MKRITVFVLAGLLLLDLTGCASARRKFVRKKHIKDEPVMYLDLKEYPQAPSEDMYSTYHVYVTGWLGELSTLVAHGTNQKRMKKAIDQAIENMDKLIAFYNDDGKFDVKTVRDELEEIKGAVYDPYFLRTGAQREPIARRVEKVKAVVMAEYGYNDAKKWFTVEAESAPVK